MIIIHTQNGVIETEGKRFVFDDKFVKVYRDDGNLIGASIGIFTIALFWRRT